MCRLHKKLHICLHDCLILKAFFSFSNTNGIVLQRIFDAVTNETKLEDQKQYGMFVLIIMSHGGENNVIRDCENNPVRLIDVKDRLRPSEFPAMKGKPKIIIVQACSGGEYIFHLVLIFF